MTRKSATFEPSQPAPRSHRGLESVNLKFPRDPEELREISNGRYDSNQGRKPATANGNTRRRAVLPPGAVLPGTLHHSMSNSEEASPNQRPSHSPLNSRGEIVVRVDTTKF